MQTYLLLQIIVVIISMASMTVGNIMALRQVNVKRMLAYSGISHAGFMLMTLLSVTNAAGVLLFTSAYALQESLRSALFFMFVRTAAKMRDHEFSRI
jgi:NADH:ubiquinone oxidoreductase subunit 2 (subunit N)